VDQDFTTGNQRSLARLRAFIGSADDAKLRQPMSDGWTVSAYLAHIAYFDRRVSRVIERTVKQGPAPSPMDVHILNDSAKPVWLALDPRAAAAEAIAAAEEANAAVDGLSPEIRAEILDGQIVSLDRAHHRNHHLDEFDAL
jgi:uncharacterized damage-inducible protein DinB